MWEGRGRSKTLLLTAAGVRGRCCWQGRAVELAVQAVVRSLGHLKVFEAKHKRPEVTQDFLSSQSRVEAKMDRESEKVRCCSLPPNTCPLLGARCSAIFACSVCSVSEFIQEFGI